MNKSWVVVQCRHQETTKLCEALQGIIPYAWVPMMVRKMRLPRTKKTATVSMPMLPGFVFCHQDALAYGRGHRVRDLPIFWPMVVNSKVVVLNDLDLLPLRVFEANSQNKSEDDSFSEIVQYGIGEEMVIPLGVFAGKRAIVIERDANYYSVILRESNMTVKIGLSTFELPRHDQS